MKWLLTGLLGCEHNADRKQTPNVPLLCLKMAATSQESTWWPTFVWACVKLDWRQTDIAVTVLGLERTLPQLKLEWKIVIKMLDREPVGE